MKHFFSELFHIEKKPKRGFLPIEWTMFAYMGFTFLMIFFTYTKLVNPHSMIVGRIQVAAMTLALWGVYRLLPCRLTLSARIFAQMGLLAWWYPDTYELNRVLPNLDHVFASCEQALFGMQPSLVFSKALSSPIFSELIDLGYASFYPMIALTAFFYFAWRQKEFQRCTWVIIASFFAYYVIYDLLPVVGPTFYFKAIGLENVAKGIFPSVNDYFNHHQGCLVSPGYQEGLFYHLVEDAKAAGERPTAAFPSSHVGIATVCMLLIGHTRNRRLLWLLVPFYAFLCLATVYIQAHYVIDAIAGFVSGVAFYFLFMFLGKKVK